MSEDEIGCKVCKVSDQLGIVFGWAMISTFKGKPYVDTQGDHIPEDAMLKAATDFMMKRRAFRAMHQGDAIGTVVYAWPLTKELAAAFKLESDTTGFMIGVKPNDPEVLEKFKLGEYTGFSIGGVRIKDEEM